MSCCSFIDEIFLFFSLFSYISFYLGIVQEQRSDANDVEMNGVKVQAVKDTKKILKD